jgi:CRISPR-associated protein Cas2
MLIVCYDISNDKIRTNLADFLSKFGYRLQYSVFEIRNSERVLKNIITEIENTYVKHFTESDSIVIFNLSETCKKTCYGYAKHADEEFILVG